MYLRSTLLPLLFLLVVFQSPQDSLRQHYEAAEAARRTGNLPAAENEFRAILAEAYTRLGEIYSAQKDYSNAVATLEAAALYRADAPDALVALAVAYFNTAQYERAFEPLRKALAQNPDHPGARHMLGKTYFMRGEFAPATAELETALRLAPRDYDVAYTLGLAHLKQHQFAPAREIYERMLAQLGDRPQLRIIFGRAYRETGFLPEAIEEFKKAVALDTRFPRAHYYLGLTYLLKDGATRLGDAAQEFKIELAANPDEFFANYYLGIVYLIERRWADAIGLLQKASRIEPNNPDPYFHLGQALQGADRHAEAIEALRKAIALNPRLSHNDYQVTTAHYRLGQSLLKVGQREAGERELQTASELKSKALNRDKEKTGVFLSGANLQEQGNKFPELGAAGGIVAQSLAPDAQAVERLRTSAAFYSRVVASAHNNVGLLRAERQDFRAAAEQFALASKWDAALDGLHFNHGLAAYKAELYKEAIAPLVQELKARPANVAAKQLLGLSYFMTDNYAQASELLADVVAVKHTDVSLHYTLALALIKQGKKADADRAIEQMVALSGNSPQLHILLGQAHYERGDTDKALEELKTALTLDSKTLLAHYYAGVVYLKMGKLSEAAREFEAELALNARDVQAKYHLAFVLLARQETARGVGLMKTVVELRPDYADARYELGKALLQQGDIKGALEHLEIAGRLDPEKPHVHYQLGRAYLAAGRQAEAESHLETSRQLKEKVRTQTNQ
ncbi:MAG TPA: tetratricopeptide repeat protein [Pyrinomonadaceae bacterium]|jgi:tetratricopeptide (TPR) repeat protein